jgi:hypothetical protein
LPPSPAKLWDDFWDRVRSGQWRCVACPAPVKDQGLSRLQAPATGARTACPRRCSVCTPPRRRPRRPRKEPGRLPTATRRRSRRSGRRGKRHPLHSLDTESGPWRGHTHQSSINGPA